MLSIAQLIVFTATIIVAGVLLHGIRVISLYVLNDPSIDEEVNPSVKPYDYKPKELWEPPAHWKSWPSYSPTPSVQELNIHGDDHWATP